MESRPDFRKSVAVVVGINAYDHGVPPLRTAAADARRLAQLLADEHGYAVHLLLDGEATREALTDLLTVDLPATVGADDRVLFYFAGHGVAVEGDDGPSGYLLLHDARRGEHETYLPMPALYDALNALPCRHLLAILDSCFAGAFRWSATRDMVDLPAVIHQERYDRFILDPAWQAIASASHDQKALDQLPTSDALTSFADFGTRGDGGVHSPFAAALIEALEGAGDVVPAGGGDGVITATELYLYLEQRLQPATMEAGYRQTPRLWPLAKHDKGEFIFLAPGHELNLPPAPELTFENNPWLGLRSYDEGDEELFFGRESVITTLADYVEEHPLTVVLGASGTGKSSVVKAGLVPQLKRDTTQAWRVLPIVRPGPAPMQALERAVAELESEGGIEERIAAWCATHPGDRLVLVVDQFEELATLVRAPEERNRVLALLTRLVEGHPDRLRLVLTLRSDFEPQFDRTALEMHWKQARFVVPPMTQADLRDVIERPASERVMYFKPAALVDDLIDEVIQTPGGLPLLSFALSEMYVHYLERYTRGETDDRALGVEDYSAVGGVVGALRARAEAEYGALDAAHRESMRRLMLRMVAAEGGTVARRRVAPSELDYPDPAETERVRTVVRQLTAARLLVEGQGEDGEAYVEPAHDALVRAWDRLIGWLHTEEDQAATLRLQQSMAQAAHEWEKTEDTKARAGLLWRDAARSALLAPLVAEEEGRLDAESLTVEQRLRRRLRLGSRTSDAAQSTWMNRRELAFARRSIRRRRNIRLGLSVTVLVVVATAITATAFGIRALKSETEALAQTARADSTALVAQANEREALEQAARADSTTVVAKANAEEAEANEREAEANAREAEANAREAQENARESQARFLVAEMENALRDGDRPLAFRLAQAAWRKDDNATSRAALRRLSQTVLPLASIEGDKVLVPDNTPLIFTTRAIYDGQGRLVDSLRADHLAFAPSGAYFLAIYHDSTPSVREAEYVLHDGTDTAVLARFAPGNPQETAAGLRVAEADSSVVLRDASGRETARWRGGLPLVSDDGEYILSVRDVTYSREFWMTWDLRDVRGELIDTLVGHVPALQPWFHPERLGPYDVIDERVTLLDEAERPLLGFEIYNSEGETDWAILNDWQSNLIADFVFSRSFDFPPGAISISISSPIYNEPERISGVHDLLGPQFAQTQAHRGTQFFPVSQTLLLWDNVRSGELWSVEELRHARWLDGTYEKLSEDATRIVTRDGDDLLVWTWGGQVTERHRGLDVFPSPDPRLRLVVREDSLTAVRVRIGSEAPPAYEDVFTFGSATSPNSWDDRPEQFARFDPEGRGFSTLAFDSVSAIDQVGGPRGWRYRVTKRLRDWRGTVLDSVMYEIEGSGAEDAPGVKQRPGEERTTRACAPASSLCAEILEKTIVVWDTLAAGSSRPDAADALRAFDVYERGVHVTFAPSGRFLLGVTASGRTKIWTFDPIFDPEAFLVRYDAALRPLTPAERTRYGLYN